MCIASDHINCSVLITNIHFGVHNSAPNAISVTFADRKPETIRQTMLVEFKSGMDKNMFSCGHVVN